MAERKLTATRVIPRIDPLDQAALDPAEMHAMVIREMVIAMFGMAMSEACDVTAYSVHVEPNEQFGGWALILRAKAEAGYERNDA